MKGGYADKVLENVHFLSQNTRSLYHIMRSLSDKGILTSREAKSMMLLPDSYTKSYDLYHQLADKGEDACRALLEIWKNTGNDQLIKKVVTTSDIFEETANTAEIFELIGEEDSFKIFKSFPAEIQSVQHIREIDFNFVEIDAFTFPKVLEKCSRLQKLKLNKVKISGIFPTTKISMEYLKEFHLNLAGGRINYYRDATESVRFLIFFDTAKIISNEYSWELNGRNIWKQNCDIIIADDGKVLLATFPKEKSLTASLIDAQSIIKDVDSDLEKLKLSRVKLSLKNYPKQYYNMHENLSELILHYVDTEDLAALILSSRKLKTLKVIANNYPPLDISQLPPNLDDLSLGFINLTNNENLSFSIATVAFDFCTFSQDIQNNFCKAFQCKNVFVGGEGYLFQPGLSFVTHVIKNSRQLQWICISGLNNPDFYNVHQLDDIDLTEVPTGAKHCTFEIVNGLWKGQKCSDEQMMLIKYELFGWDSFWEKEKYINTQSNLYN